MQRMMIIGTIVTAVPTFLLCIGERWDLLLIYMVIFSIGEALWQPRFYQFAADLAPEGEMGVQWSPGRDSFQTSDSFRPWPCAPP